MPLKRADIEPGRRRELQSGVVASASLVEWLAIDQIELLAAVLAAHGHAAPPASWRQETAALPLNRRLQQVALHLHGLGDPALLAILAAHPSDSVRIWAAIVVGLDPEDRLASRVQRLLPFAADAHFGVREYAWMALRPHLADDVQAGIELLTPLVHDADSHLRRFAVEATRPRGVWCAHLKALRAEPELGRPLLEPLHDESTRYVQLSVANWLNDASKDHPGWVQGLCDDWLRRSDSKATRFITHHAQRTLRLKEKRKVP